MAGLSRTISISSVTTEQLDSYSTVASFPDATLNDGRIVFLNAVDGVNQPGLYLSNGTVWTNTNTGKIRSVNTLTIDRDITASDVDAFIYSNEVSDIDFTVLNDSTLNIPVRSEFVFGNQNTGALNIVADTGVTIISKDNLTGVRSGGPGASLIKISANTYWLFGDLV